MMHHVEMEGKVPYLPRVINAGIIEARELKNDFRNLYRFGDRILQRSGQRIDIPTVGSSLRPVLRTPEVGFLDENRELVSVWLEKKTLEMKP